MAFNLGEAQAKISLDISDLAGKSAQAQGILTGLDGAAGKATGGMSALTKGFLAFGAAAIPAMITGVREAVNLEQSITNVNAALGGVDAGTLEGLADTFRQIGVESQYSATQVAGVGEGLAKAGFTTEEIMNGATQAVVNLAQATGDGLDPAMTAVISTMNTWNETAAKSGQAVTDASRVADVFTIAANESSAGIADINAGMRNLGPVAVALGIPFEDAAAAIALFTNNGLKGADAGISLARGFQNLADPTSEAARWMDQLGIAAFDMNGNFVGMPELFDQLQTGMAGLDDQTKLTALSTIFGAEAMDVMGLAILNGADPLQALIDLMGESGAAAEQSALRMDTLGAQWGTLTEGATTLLASLVSGLIPGMRLVVDFANTLVDAFMKIPGPIKTVIGAITALAAAFATLTGAGAGLRMLGITGAFGGISAAPFLALAAGIGIAYAAIKFNLFGIGDAIAKFTSVWNNLADSAANNSISRFLIALGQALQTFDIAALDNLGRGLDAVGKSVNAFFDGFRGPGGKAVEKTTKQFEGFAELAEDGVTWKVKTEGGEDIGEIIDSWDNADGTTTVRIKTKGGEEFETTIDMVTGFVEGDYEVEVEVDAKDARKQIDRLQDGLDAMTGSLEKSKFPWLATFPRAASRVLDSVRTLTEGFRMARQSGADPLEASLRALGMTIPGLSSATARLEMGWRDLKTAFGEFRDQGIGPVSAAFLTLGETFPTIQTAMRGLADVTENLGDAFLAGVRGDWSQAFLDLREAAAGAWVVVQELGSAVGTVAVNIGNWVMGAIPDVWAWLQDTAIPALGTGAVWLWDALVNIGSWAKGIVSDIWPYITTWASDAIGAIASAAGTLWGVIVNIGSWAKGIVSDLWPYVSTWASEALGGITSAAGTLWGVLVNIGSWAKGIVSDLAPYVAMWASDAVAGITSAAATVWGVLVNIGSWAKGIVSDVWPYITMWASDAIAGLSGAAGTLWNVTLNIGSWAKGQLPDIGAAIQDWAQGEYDSAVAGGRAPKIETVQLDVGSVEVKSDGTAAEQANAEGRMFGFALADNAIRGIQTGWDWVFGGGGGGGGGGAAGPGGGGLAGFIASIGRGFDIVASSISGAFQGGTDAIIADLESGDGLSSRLGDAFLDMFDFSHASWMGESLDNLLGPIDEFFGDVGKGIKKAWDEVRDIDLPGFDLKMPDIGVDWGPIDTIIEQIKEKGQALKDAWTDLRQWIADHTGGGDKTNTEMLIDALDVIKDTGLPSVYDFQGQLDQLNEQALQGGAAVAGNFVKGFTSQQGAITAAVATIGADIGAISATLAAIPPATITVTANTTAAAAAMGATASALTALNGQSSTVQVLGDNANALAAVDGAAGALGAIAGASALTFVNGDNSGALGAIGDAGAALGDLDGDSATTYIYCESLVDGAVSLARAALQGIDGMTATTYINTVSSGGASIGAAVPRATGGTVREPLTLVGERGPELVSLPYGAYVHPTGTGPQGGGVTYVVDLSGSTFHNTSREEMNYWAAEDLMPMIQTATNQRGIAKGLSQ